MAKTAAQLSREINDALNRRVESGELPPYEGMPVTVTKYGAFHHNLRAGAPGVITRVASADARRGTPSARARVLVSVDGNEISTDWPTAAFQLKGTKTRRGSTRRAHATKVADWTARQMTSGRRVVEKTRGDKIARIFQGENHWTVTINRRDPRGPFETTGEIKRQSAKTLAAAKSLGTRLLKAR